MDHSAHFRQELLAASRSEVRPPTTPRQFIWELGAAMNARANADSSTIYSLYVHYMFFVYSSYISYILPEVMTPAAEVAVRLPSADGSQIPVTSPAAPANASCGGAKTHTE